MARLGVCILVSWQNARINNPSKLNLIMRMFRYNQSRWDYKVEFKNAYKTGECKTFSYTYISSEGTLAYKWNPRLVFTDRYSTKHRFNNYTCEIGVNWFTYKSVGLRVMAQNFGETLMIMHPPYDLFPITDVTINNVFDISLIRLFMQTHEAMFRI